MDHSWSRHRLANSSGSCRDERGVLPHVTATPKLRQRRRTVRSWCRSGGARCSAAFSSPAPYSQRWRRWCLCGTARRRPPCPALPSLPRRTTCWVSIVFPRDDILHLNMQMAGEWRKWAFLQPRRFALHPSSFFHRRWELHMIIGMQPSNGNRRIACTVPAQYLLHVGCFPLVTGFGHTCV